MDDGFGSTGDRPPARGERANPVDEPGLADESASTAADVSSSDGVRSNGIDCRPCATDDRATVTCEVALPDELIADLDRYCRESHRHREAAVSELLDAWLERRAAES